jgi:hypothetical protein
VRARNPEVLFLAEAYWDLEWQLAQQGFDYCYDKRLYDRLVQENAHTVRLHLRADPSYQARLLRFLENHDEPRAAAVFAPARLRAAALAVATLPGAKLFHEGQLEGRKVRVPVQLGRRPEEPVDADLSAFYRSLLEVACEAVFREGIWQLCEQTGWLDNASHRNLVAWCVRHGDERRLIVVNLSEQGAQARIRLPWPDLAGRSWRLADRFRGEIHERNGNEMLDPGLFIDLEAWGRHFLRF